MELRTHFVQSFPCSTESHHLGIRNTFICLGVTVETQRRHRHDWNSWKYGFLYNGYKKNYYFWESVNMYRKIAVIFVSVFLKLAGVITQALVIFLVLIIFLILNIKLKPFTFQTLNDMEMMSLITCMLTIYWGLFFISDMPSVYNSTDSSVKEDDNGRKLKNIFWTIELIKL